MTQHQQAALESVRRIATAQATTAYPSLLAKTLRLGYSQEQLDACATYVRQDAPLIINLPFGNVAEIDASHA